MQFINFSDNTASIVQVTIPVSTVQLAYRRDVWWFEAICAFLERESARWFTCTACENMSHRKFSNYFRSYLMKKYELYLTFSIIITLPMLDRDWDGATAYHANPDSKQCWPRSSPHLARMDFTRARCGPDLGQHYVAVWETSHGRRVISFRSVYEICLFRDSRSNIPTRLSADSRSTPTFVHKIYRCNC